MDFPAGIVIIRTPIRYHVRNSSNLKETIAYDNAICLNCHSNYSRFPAFKRQERDKYYSKA